jgi:hypothetical protein
MLLFHRVWALFLTATLCLVCDAATAQAGGGVSEDSIKAAFLFKFGAYIDWPPEAFESSDSPFVIGVLGAEQVADDLAGIVAERAVAGRRVEIRRLRDGDVPDGLHVLFVGRAADGNFGTMLASIANRPVLVVTETDAVQPGSTINFVVVNNKVRFDVATGSAQARNLKISARLLGVARNVTDGSS